MKDELFQELLESIREGGEILRGITEPSRAWRFEEPDVSAIREHYGLSQSKFAALLGISVRTVQNWEQGHRRPRGPARVLLRVAARHPETLLDLIRDSEGDEEPSPVVGRLRGVLPRETSKREHLEHLKAKYSTPRGDAADQTG